jgi:menaquinone-9 beta-reductase
MNRPPATYDCAITGGGMAGLCLSILLAKAGKKVILLEKEVYPFHKVSGGYFSNEGIAFLASLGVDLTSRNLPAVERMIMSAPDGQHINVALDVGGVGIARYDIDNELYHVALNAGVEIRTGIKVRSIQFENNCFRISSDHEEILARTAAGAFGRSSNLDVDLGRNYKAQNARQLFVAVEHHIRIPYDTSFVELHAFPGGYCGISAYGDGLVNLSYISRASDIKANNGIAGLEKNVLSANKYLKRFFEEGEFIFKKPLTISHVYFKIKEPVCGHILMIGDAAGNVAPISGNGMSIASHSAKLAGEAIISYLDNKLTLMQMEEQYASNYYKYFRKRIRISRQLTHLLIHPTLTNAAFPFFRWFPFLVEYVSRKIHGEKI